MFLPVCECKGSTYFRTDKGFSEKCDIFFDIRTKGHIFFSRKGTKLCVICVQLFHTELKVAVRTCEGKAIHGIHGILSTYWHVSSRNFWTTNGHEFALMPCGAGNGLTRNPRNTQNPCGVLFVSRAQTCAEVCRANSVCFCMQRFLTQRRKVSQRSAWSYFTRKTRNNTEY